MPCHIRISDSRFLSASRLFPGKEVAAMLKGIQKRMIMVRTDHSSLFETAYFVLRNDDAPVATDENAMIREANRILAESALSGKKKHTKSGKRRQRMLSLFFFLLGLLCGILLFALLRLIF